MCLSTLGSRCQFSACFMGHFHMLGLLVAYLKRFPIALNQSAIITTQFLRQWNDVSRGYKWMQHHCHFPSNTLLAVGPGAGNGWFAPLTVFFYMLLMQSSPSKLSPILYQVAWPLNTTFQNNGFNWGQKELDKPMETGSRRGEHLVCSRRECSVGTHMMLGSQPLWHVNFLICGMGTRFESLLNWHGLWYACDSPVIYCKSVFHSINLCLGL